ncbi:hypothetical protein CLV90_0435 [Maribacter spongiicola]|uniref:Uncharacterized protein n=1 Tax=Maribacter spongiicola TaxID=1206753 RepID=A0A4R7K5B0_9FLAO|nr:hypothetical protein [Maribacter spongiicola]TDT46385.1 hypothetical protein CLV90_0435 [Maribacter spongiicola]
MNRTIIILLIMFFCFNSFAQKVKIKKGKILLDNIEVGVIEAINKSEIVYSFKDLSGNELLKADVDIANGSTRPFEFNWMTITSNNYSQVNTVDYSMLSMSLSHPKIIAEILIKTYGLYDGNGFRQDKIDQFFSQPRTSKYKEDATGNGGSDISGLDEGFGGKIKVKDNQVLFDKVPVAIVKINNGVYTYTSLKDNKKLKVDFYVAELAGTDETLKWLAVSENKRRSEIKMEYLSGSARDENAITQLLSKKYNLITLNGIENVDEFFKVDRKNLTEEYRTMFNEAKESYILAENSIKYKIIEEGIRERSALSSIEKGIIYNKEDDKILGTVESLKGVNANSAEFYVKIYDTDKRLVANIISLPDSDKNEYILKGYDSNMHIVNLEGDMQFSKQTFYRNLSKVLIEYGYDFALDNGVEQAMIRDERIALEAKQKIIDDFEFQSKAAGNLRRAPGYVIMSSKKGKKIGGYITLYNKTIPLPEGVEDLEEGRMFGDRIDGKKLGEYFRFEQYIEAKTGMLKKARDGGSFCLYLQDEAEKCFAGKKLGTATYGFVPVDSLQLGN